LYMEGSSDGGNTVFQYQPCDLRTRVPYRGLGFTSAGAGAVGFAHLVCMDPVEADVKGYTLWCSFYDGIPNSCYIKHLNVAKDKSLMIGGLSAYGLVQTKGNLLHQGPPGGPYIAIMTHDFGGLRFSSIMPACGDKADIRDGERWDSSSTIVDGKCRAIFVCGAAKEGKHYSEVAYPPPKINPMQTQFGGGTLDGYLVLFDLKPDRRGSPVDKSRKRDI
jgi:hypothetical protein